MIEIDNIDRVKFCCSNCNNIKYHETYNIHFAIKDEDNTKLECFDCNTSMILFHKFNKENNLCEFKNGTFKQIQYAHSIRYKAFQFFSEYVTEKNYINNSVWWIDWIDLININISYKFLLLNLNKAAFQNKKLSDKFKKLSKSYNRDIVKNLKKKSDTNIIDYGPWEFQY